MKRIAVIFITIFVLALVLNSCKSSEHCPAYGQVETQQTTQHS